MKLSRNLSVLIVSWLMNAYSSHAALITNTEANVGGVRYQDEKYTTDLLRIESTSSRNSPVSSSGSYASSEYGILKIFTFGSTVVHSNDYHSGEVVAGFSSAVYSDTMLLESELYNNQKALMVFDIYNEILIDTNVSGGFLSSHARYGFDFQMSQSYLGIDSSRVVISAMSGGTGGYGSNTNGSYFAHDLTGTVTNSGYDINKFTLVQEFVFGQPIYFSLGMWADGHIPAASYPESEPVTARYLIDAANSSYWGGIQSIIVGDQVVTNYQLTSRSGVDYSNSFYPTATGPQDVPEPPAFAFLSLGIFSLWIFTRRRMHISLLPNYR